MKSVLLACCLLIFCASLFCQTSDPVLDSLKRPLPPGATARAQAERLDKILWYILNDENLDYEPYPEQLDSLYHCCLLNRSQDARYERRIAAKINLYKGSDLTFRDPEAATPFLESAIHQFEAIGDSAGMAVASMQLTFVASSLGDSSLFAHYYDQSVAILKNVRDLHAFVLVHNNLGITCYNFGRFAEATLHYFLALEQIDKFQSPDLLTIKRDIYHNLAGIYRRLGDYNNAMIYIRKAIESAEARGQNPRDHYISLAMIYQAIKVYDKALENFNKAETYEIENAANIVLANIHYGKANCYRNLGDNNAALFHARQAVKLLPIEVDAHFGAVAMEELAASEFSAGMSQKSLAHALLAYQTFLKAKNNGGLVRTAELLTNICKTKGDYRKALEYSELRYRYQNQIERQQSTRQLAFGEFTRNAEVEKARREAEVKAELDQQRNIRYALFAGLAVLALLAFLLYNRYRYKQKTAEQLQAKNREVEAAKVRAEQSEAFKSRFLANMSHEIRTPLHGIAGFADLLADTALSEKQRRYLSSIRHSTDRLGEVVNDILDLSKLEAGEVKLRSVPFSPARVAADVQEALSLRAQNKGIELRVDVGADVPEAVLGDPTRLYQILMNLAGNAVKFTENGAVTVKVGTTGSHPDNMFTLEFRVQDTGIGIPPEKLASIFDSFQQAGEDTTARFGGTGLGLTIARDLVRLYGSDISVESTPGQGSVFSFALVLPLADAADLETQTARSGDLYFTQPIRILLADDNAPNREIAAGAIRKHFENAEIVEAVNGKEVIELLQVPVAPRPTTNSSDERPALILMDMQMPEMTGVEAARHIRQNLHNDIPIIALTASATPEEIEAALGSGMNRHLGKPFKPRELARVVADLLGLTSDFPGFKNLESLNLPAAPEAGTGTFDLRFLRDFCDGDEAQMQHFIKKFEEQCPLEIERLEMALNDEDYEAMYRAAHSFRPQLEFAGLRGIAAILLELEKGSREGAAFGQLAVLLARVKDGLNAMR